MDFVQNELRVIRAFRSTLEDLNERRSMHSLRSPRNTIPGYPLYNSYLLNSNYAQQQQQRSNSPQQQQPYKNNNHSGGGSNGPATSATLLTDITYIDEEPHQQLQQRSNLLLGHGTAAAINGHSITQRSNALSDAKQQLHQQQKQLQTETRI